MNGAQGWRAHARSVRLRTPTWWRSPTSCCSTPPKLTLTGIWPTASMSSPTAALVSLRSDWLLCRRALRPVRTRRLTALKRVSKCGSARCSFSKHKTISWWPSWKLPRICGDPANWRRRFRLRTCRFYLRSRSTLVIQRRSQRGLPTPRVHIPPYEKPTVKLRWSRRNGGSTPKGCCPTSTSLCRRLRVARPDRSCDLRNGRATTRPWRQVRRHCCYARNAAKCRRVR